MGAENATSQTAATTLETATHIIALNGSGWVVLPISAFKGPLEKVAAKTASHTVLTSEVGTIFTNEGATGTVVLSLPAATVGLHYRAIVRAAFALRFDPQSGEVISHTTAGTADGGAGKYTGSSTLGADIELVCVTAGRWEANANKGTWTLET